MTDNEPKPNPTAEPGEVAAETRRKRRTLGHLIFTLAVVAAFAAAIGFLFWRDDGGSVNPTPTASPTTSPTVDSTQPTVLIQASGDSGAAANMLTGVGVGANPDAILVSMSAKLMVAAPANAPQTLQSTPISPDTLRAKNSVAATLGVRVDGTWTLDRKALAGLVDSVGGMTVDLKAPMKVLDGAGDVVLNLRAGKSKLTGTQASWYAVGTVKGEPDAASVARASQVLTYSLVNLPTDTTTMRETITSLGFLAPSTLPTQELADYLVELTKALRNGERHQFTLPTTQISIGKQEYQWVDYNNATPELRRTLPLAQWSTQSGVPPRILVMTGRETPGLIASTRSGLTSLGFVYVDGRGTTPPPGEESMIQVRGAQPWGLSVAKELGLPKKSIVSSPATDKSPNGQPWANVDVILGDNYRP